MADYALAIQPTFLSHSADMPAWLADFAGEYGEYVDGHCREFNVVDAMAASGDYFITLATRLDKIAQSLPADSTEQIEIEHLVTTLFYLQDYWQIVRKPKPRNLK